MKRYRPEEPLTIDGRVVAETLDDLGYERMAAFVRDLSASSREANLREMELVKRNNELAARLHVYEPPPEPAQARRTSEWE